MPFTVPSAVFPSERRAIGIAKETTPGTGVTPAYSIPMVGFIPEDKPIWLPDESMRNAMAMTYGLIQGPYVADLTFDASPVYTDTIGHFLYNILGDYTTTGTAATPSTTLTSAATAGATTLTVASGTSFTANMWIQIDTGTLAEVVQVATGAATTITLQTSTPLRFDHANSTAVTNTSGPYTHVFSLLNGTGNAQPPTHTITDRTYIPATVEARWYPFTCMTEMVFTGNSEKLFEWSGKGLAYANKEPAAAPTTTYSTIPAQASWSSTVGLGGTISANQIFQLNEWEFTLTRVVEPYYTADGYQDPYILGRGKFSVTGKATFTPTIDQVPLTDMLNNTQPQLQVLQTNGLTGTSAESIQFDMQYCAFDASVIAPGKALFGYNDTFQGIANTTNTGQSAGYSPIQVTIVNQVPSF